MKKGGEERRDKDIRNEAFILLVDNIPTNPH